VDKERLKFVLQEAACQKEPRLFQRDLVVPLGTGKIVVLVGIRRSGKTFLLYDIQKRLLASGMDRRQIIRLSFEDDRLHPIKAEEFDQILQAHAELYPDLAGKRRVFLFDEVQSAPGWERFVRRLQDTQAGDVYLTGSSSQLLSSEIATGLRGRCVSYEVFPLSFAEYLRFRGLEAGHYTTEGEGRLASDLDDYLQIGGLPEVVLAEASLRPKILREYMDLVFYRDLVDRHKVGNPEVLKEILRYCMGNPASLFNPHKLYQDMHSRGYSLGKDTIYKYIHYLEEAYLLYLVPLCDPSIRKQAINPKKMHPVDWSAGLVYRPGKMLDMGRRLETAVYLHHRRKGLALSYYAGPAEIDLVEESTEGAHWVNTAWSLTDDDTWRREEAAITRDGSPQSRILVVRESANRIAPGGARIINAWRYLLGQESTAQI
jgi:uncharacterized protein